MKTNNLTISPKTKALIDCLESANLLWEQVFKALAIEYEEATVLDIMDDFYKESHFQLKDTIGKLIIQSIETNIGIKEIGEI